MKVVVKPTTKQDIETAPYLVALNRIQNRLSY